jgi:hypothetical protein
MANEPENHTIRLLQEMRTEMRAEFARVREEMRSGFMRIWEEFGNVHQRFAQIDEKFADVNLRLDGLTNIVTLLAGQSHDHEERIAKLESGKE